MRESITERIPPTAELRERLAVNLRERDLLKRLLRLAECAEREQQREVSR